MKILVKILVLQFARRLCMDETYFYFSLTIPSYFVIFLFPPSMFSAVLLVILHYICWKYLMRPAFKAIGDMETDRKEIENAIIALKIKQRK